MIKAILIDLDNTLLDFDKCAEFAMKTGFEKIGFEYKPDMFHTFTQTNNFLWSQVEKGTLTKSELRKKRWNMIFEKLGKTYDGESFEKEFETLLSQNGETVDGAQEILKYLCEKYTVYIVTNGFYDIQKKRIKAAGLDGYADELIVSQSIGFSKPSHEFFDYCMKKLALKKEEVLVIGDSLLADIKGGKDYGLHTCWFNFTGSEDKSCAEFSVKKLHELFMYL